MSPFSRVRTCPYCMSHDVRRSQRQGAIENCLLPLLLMRPYRCITCNYRYIGTVFARRTNREAAIVEEERSEISPPSDRMGY